MRPRRLASLGIAAVAWLVAAPARADLGTHSFDGWAWSDSKGAGSPRAIPRYVTAPVATAVGNGTINQPTLPLALWDYTTSAAKFPVETWTLTATSSTTFSVVGSMSGSQPAATVGTAYTSPKGLNFTIAAGTTAFAAGDKFVFQVVDHYDTKTLPGATSHAILPTGYAILPAPGITIRTQGSSGNVSLVAYAVGYLAFTATTAPKILRNYYAPQSPNGLLPEHRLSHGTTVHVLPFWDELIAKPTSTVWTAVIGRVGQRVYVIEYNDFAHANDQTASFTFQVVFFENTDKVRFHYVAMQNGTGTFGNGSGATIGLQPRVGVSYAASVYSTNAPSIVDGLTVELGSDADADRLPLGIEQLYGTNAANRFSDAGTPALSDSAQLVAGIDPTNATDNATKSTDTDSDTLLDAEEAVLGTKANVGDTDADGVRDDVEVAFGYDPTVADTDGDGRSDGQEDANGNGAKDGTETSALLWDSDADGIDDGREVALASDPIDPASSRMSAPLTVTSTLERSIDSVIDSKGNLHIITIEQLTNNQTPDELQVALYSPATNTWAASVAATDLTSHTGFDDRLATIAVVPGAAGSTVDRTFVFNGTRNGYAFLTEIDFSAAARDGSASDTATIVKATRMIAIGVSVDHPHMQFAGGKLHIVFQGTETVGLDRIQGHQQLKGSYYLQLDLSGDVTAGPTLLYQKGSSSHHHTSPRIAVDGAGNVHAIVRGGSCRYDQGPVGCALYYTKLSSLGTILIPTTKLKLEGDGGFHRNPEIVISPNGLVNVIYTTNAPVISASGDGGYSIGNEVRLYSFATTNNQLTTVIDQKPLFNFAPDQTIGPKGIRIPTYRTPSVALDAGGNLHVLVGEDSDLHQGIYAAFAPNGERKLGPYHIGLMEDWQHNGSIQVANATTVLVTWKARTTAYAMFRQIDITGSGLDLTGASQVPLPTSPLSLTGVTPNTITVGDAPVVAVTGSGMSASTTIMIGGIAATSIAAVDAATVAGKLSSSGLAAGDYDVVVVNPDGAMASLPGGFHVVEVPVEQPPMEMPTDDGGCCDTGRRSPLGSFLLASLVLVHLSRRRRCRRRGVTGALLALLALLGAAGVLAPRSADAGLGTRDFNGMSWVDSKGATGPRVFPRYVTVPVRTATGNGTIDHPILPAKLWDYVSGTVKIPLETWTLTATSSTTFTVVGSTTGALANATVGTTYNGTNGLSFTITAGATAFVAGDKFVFQVIDHVDASTIPGATSYTFPPNGVRLLPSLPFTVQVPGKSTTQLVAYDAGYVTATYASPTLGTDFYARQASNQALPAHALSNSRSVHMMPFWDELFQKATSKLWVATFGRAGGRIAVLEYNDFALKADPTASLTFQIVLFEGQQRVRYQYIKLQNGGESQATGASATVGLQQSPSNGYTATQYSTSSASLQEGLVIEIGPDSDVDRLPGGIEAQYGTSDSTRFSDGGTPALSDSAQLLASLDPTTPADNAAQTSDMDSDGILDLEEAALGTNPAAKDTDADGLDDGIEVTTGVTDPLAADTDGDGLKDGDEDADKTGDVSGTETSPADWDSDDDGVSDSDEIAQGTDPVNAAASRMSAAIRVTAATPTYGVDSALDTHGNLHIVGTQQSSATTPNTPDDMYVALMTKSGAAYAISVDATVIDSHTGMDDRYASIVTVPGASGSTVDRTFILDNTRTGYLFLTEIDFGLASRDGSASTAATIVKSTRMIAIGVAADHPDMTYASGKLHVVFQGQELLGAQRFARNTIARGSYYMQLGLDGDVAVQPMLLYQRPPGSHHHSYPRIAVDAAGNIHSVVRAGTCRWEIGPIDCALFYTKLSSAGAPVIPTTKLQFEGNGGLHRSPEIVVSPNGVVNIIYTTNAPVISTGSNGGYDLGNEVRLYAFATVNDQLTPLIDQKPLFSWVPEPSQGLPSALSTPTWRTPAVAMDPGGNLHVFIVEDHNTRGGYYAAFAPNGDRKVGPYQIPNADYWSLHSIQVTGSTVLFAYHDQSYFLQFRQLDITGNPLDETGGGLLPLPTPDALSVTAISPDTVAVGTGMIVVTVKGAGFVAGSKVVIGGVPMTSGLTFDAGNLIGNFDATGLAEGGYDVVVSNPNGAMATLTEGFWVGERPTTPPDEPMPTTSGGCCEVGGGHASSLLLAGLVALLLGRRRQRLSAARGASRTADAHRATAPDTSPRGTGTTRPRGRTRRDRS